MIEFTEGNLEKIERKAGIYFLYDSNKQLLYVGKAHNLYYRLVNHLKTKKGKIERFDMWFVTAITSLWKEDIKYVDCIVMEKNLLKEKERCFIRELKPPLNTQFNPNSDTDRCNKNWMKYNEDMWGCGLIKRQREMLKEMWK